MTNERVGFIGVGFMGEGMASCLLAGGYPLTVLAHRNRAPVEALLAAGAREASSAAELARDCTVVHLCVTDAPAVEAVVNGPGGLREGLGGGRAAGDELIVADCSTSDPVLTRRLAAELAPLGAWFCDVPLGGTPAQAAEGQLSAMVGAEDAAFARLEPVLSAWASRIVRVGGPGAGHTLKLLNNFVALGYAALYAEALALAGKHGVTAEGLDGVLRGSRMDCGFYQTFFRYVLERDRDAHKFTLRNALKDMRYVEGLADAANLANPLGNAIKNAYALAVGAGRGDDYVPQLTDVIAELNGGAPRG